MQNRRHNLLLVEDDLELAEMIVRCLEEASSATVTHVTSAADALREELTTRHHVIIASMSLGGGDGLDCIRELRITNRCPVILLADEVSVEQTIEAMRLGVKDVLFKPFDIEQLCETVGRAAEREAKRRWRRVRYRRLRRLTSRIVRERRDLHQRMDLICQDFVYAYRRVAQRVSESGILANK